MQHIFIIGSKGIPAAYGGFETFVEKLTQYQKSIDIKYHVACMGDENREFEYNHAHCFRLRIPQIGSVKAVYYDLAALKYCIAYIKNNQIKDAVIYILACRIGPFIGVYKKKIQQLGGHIFVNPDGHEWKRAKWNWLIRRYWKLSEKLMVKYSDLLICDSKNIEKYITQNYKRYHPKTTFIAYGAETEVSDLPDDDLKVKEWYDKVNVKPHEYFLIVGRFVPENNFETMIKEFLNTNSKKDLVLITGIESNKFYKKLKEITCFDKDNRIKFVGTVYNQELLKKIRENAYAYLHGHEVGGTNPSLLEALSCTKVNLLLNVGFNKEVAEEGALYWTKESGNLASVIDCTDNLDIETIERLGSKAKKRIKDFYLWSTIIGQYEFIWKNHR